MSNGFTTSLPMRTEMFNLVDQLRERIEHEIKTGGLPFPMALNSQRLITFEDCKMVGTLLYTTKNDRKSFVWIDSVDHMVRFLAT